ncbi:MAG: MATE family efflux transporter [Spirosomataceae bacterium]
MLFSKPVQQEIKETVGLAIPIIIAQLGVVLMGVADNIMVGRMLGKTALGAAGLANSIAFMVGSLAVGGLAVVAPLVSKANAEQDTGRISQLFRASIWVAIGFSVVLTTITGLCAAYFPLFGQPDSVNVLAEPFLWVIGLSNIPLILFVATKQLSDGLGLTRVAMSVTLVGLAINVVLNYLGMSEHYLDLGILGAAYATLTTRVVMFVVLFGYVRWNRRFEAIFQAAYAHLPLKEMAGLITKLSIPGGFQFFFEIAAFSIAVIMMGWIGENELAAHQVAINIASTFYMMASGIGFAGGIRVGDGRGQGRPSQIRRSGNVAVGLVIAFMSTTMLAMIFLDEWFVSLYLNEPTVRAIAIRLIFIAAIFQLSDGLQVVALGTLRGLSDVTLPTIITFVAYWVIALPLGYVLAFYTDLAERGVWYGLLAGLTASAVLLLFRFYHLTQPEQIRRKLVG